MEKSQITIKDIAEIAGVSFSTVSRCLNDSSLVKDETKRKVAEIADRVGFEFNASARGLITREVGTVGIILPEQYTEVSVNVYHGMLMNNLRTSLEKADFDLIVTYQMNHYTGKNNVIRLFTQRKVDGLIILVSDLSSDTLAFLKSHNVPFVFTHYPPAENIKNQDVIYTDHEAGGKLAAEHLLSRGYRAFVLLMVEDGHLEFRLREKGFIGEIEPLKLPHKTFYCSTDFDSAYKEVSENIDEIKKAEALFAANDLMALGAIKALQAAGLRIPEDIAVVGYDDSAFGKYCSPALTSIHQPREELAVLSCDRLFYQMEKKKQGGEILKKLISIQPVLVHRESS